MMNKYLNESSNGSFNLTQYLIRMTFRKSTFYLHRYCSLIWTVSGLILNILSFIIWTRPRLRCSNTSANYLAGIAITDIFFWSLYIIYYLQMSWDINVQDIPVWCEIFQGLFISVQYYSVPLVLIFSVERYIAVCYPFQREKLCTHRKALINTVSCGVVVVILGSVQSISQKYNFETGKCETREWLVLSYFWSIFTTGTEILISAILPFGILIVNILVIVEIKAITKKTSLLKHSAKPKLSKSNQRVNLNRNSGANNSNDKHSSKPPNKEKSAYKSSTILLLCVSFLLIFTTLPVGLIYALQFLFQPGNETLTLDQMKTDPTWIKFQNYQILKEIVDFFAMSHFSINFIIYYITGKNFRSEFCALFTKSKHLKSFEDNSILNSHSAKNKNDNYARKNRTHIIRKNPSQTLLTNG